MAGLGACTLQADMTISSQDTYDVVLEMRDTTGETITAQTNCQDYANPEFVGSTKGTTVKATSIGSADDDQGLGCRVEVSNGVVRDAQTDATVKPLVSRDGDLYIVDLTGLAGAGGGAEAASGAATDGASAAPGADQGKPDAVDGSTPITNDAATGALNNLVDTSISVTFPGAVVDAGGGTVTGRTVTWTDTAQVMNGVKATGYATDSRGLSLWERFGWWVVGGLAALGAGLGVAVLVRRRRMARQREEARRRAAELRPPRPKASRASAARKARRKRSRRSGRPRRS